MKKIYYWSPHLSNDIATIKSVKNSASSLRDYSDLYSVSILDSVGEWAEHKNFFETKKIEIISLGFCMCPTRKAAAARRSGSLS